LTQPTEDLIDVHLRLAALERATQDAELLTGARKIAEAIVAARAGQRGRCNPGRSEFTVNIALIEHGTPVAGAVYAPALHQLYVGGTNAYKLDTRTTDGGELCFSKKHPIMVRQTPPQGRRAVVSRSHRDRKRSGKAYF
jgi:hypothetical protein